VCRRDTKEGTIAVVVVVVAAVPYVIIVLVVGVRLSLLFVDFHAQPHVATLLSLPLLKCDNSIACKQVCIY